MIHRVLIDAREFVPKRFTGIGRIIEGLVDALVIRGFVKEVILAVINHEAVPYRLTYRLTFIETKTAKQRLTIVRLLGQFTYMGIQDSGQIIK